MLLTDKNKKIDPKKIPSYLIYEELNGNILPYKGFREVLNGKKKIEDIIGSSSLQAAIVYIIGLFIGNTINRKKYQITSNESGLNVETGSNLANDIAIFNKENLILNEKYFNVAPKIVIEVDIKIDLSLTEWTNEWDYVLAKSKKMLEFGTEKVIWITTKSKKIFVADHTEKWFLVEFNENIPIIDECTLNLAQLLKDEDIDF
jgi:Uma2 family endonuclease